MSCIELVKQTHTTPQTKQHTKHNNKHLMRTISLRSAPAQARALASRLGKWKLECNAASFGSRLKMQDITCCTFLLDSHGDPAEGLAPSGRVLLGTEFGNILIMAVMEEPRAEDEYDIGHVLSGHDSDDDSHGDGGSKVKKPIEWQARGALLSVCKESHGKGSVEDICGAGSSDIVASVGKDGMLKIWR